MYLVIDKATMPALSDMYRLMPVSGGTYTEEQLREWIKRVWGTHIDDPLPVLAKAAAQGGWKIFKLI